MIRNPETMTSVVARNRELKRDYRKRMILIGVLRDSITYQHTGHGQLSEPLNGRQPIDAATGESVDVLPLR